LLGATIPNVIELTVFEIKYSVGGFGGVVCAAMAAETEFPFGPIAVSVNVPYVEFPLRPVRVYDVAPEAIPPNEPYAETFN